MLVRKLIGKRLAEYYNQPSSLVVGAPKTEVSLRSLLGEWQWRRLYQRLYEEQEGQWLTPVELFQPFYSRVFANFIEKSSNTFGQKRPVEVVELGGGRGTNCLCVLDHLAVATPDVYDRCTYTIIDNSGPLLDLQRDFLGQTKHAGKVLTLQKDLIHVAERRESLLPIVNSSAEQPNTIVIGLEVLDNLPHDKIRVKTRGSSNIEQAEVRKHPSGEMVEVFTPLTDPLLKHVLSVAPTYRRRPRGVAVAWVPSVACGVLQQLANERPLAHVALADFDWLPAPDKLSPDSKERNSQWGEGEPITTSMDKIDHECYLAVPEQKCDILFPTDFDRLAEFSKVVWHSTASSGRPDVAVYKQSRFLEQFGQEHVQQTKSWLTGFTPLLHDFGNCSVLVVTQQPAQ